MTERLQGGVMTVWTTRRSKYAKCCSLHFSASSLCWKREQERERGSALGGQPFFLSWGKVSKSPPLTFFWTQRSPWTEVAQNWHRPPWCCQGQPLCRGVAGAKTLFCFFVPTSLPDSERGGWRINRTTPYYTVHPHASTHGGRLPRHQSVSHFLCYSVA